MPGVRRLTASDVPWQVDCASPIRQGLAARPHKGESGSQGHEKHVARPLVVEGAIQEQQNVVDRGTESGTARRLR